MRDPHAAPRFGRDVGAGSDPREGPYGLRERGEVTESLAQDALQDLPIETLVVADGDVAEADHG